MSDLFRLFNSGFVTPRDARDIIVERIYDRSILVIFAVDDLFPKEGYTYAELNSYLKTHIDLDALQRREGVRVFCTSEEDDFEKFQRSVHQAKERRSVIVMFSNNPADSIILDQKDVLVMYGEGAEKNNISRTRHVACLPHFRAACDALAWLRYDMESSRYKIPELPVKHRIDWSQYPEIAVRL